MAAPKRSGKGISSNKLLIKRLNTVKKLRRLETLAAALREEIADMNTRLYLDGQAPAEPFW